MNMTPLNICVLVLLSICHAVLSEDALGDDGPCSNFINHGVCSNKVQSLDLNDKSCSARYEGFKNVHTGIRKYINTHIIHSYLYILLSTNFGNHKINRPGFEALYRKLSDETWEDAVELIQYNAKRGGDLANYNDVHNTNMASLIKQQNKSITEYNSLATALDLHKELASEARDIHKEAQHLGDRYHDPEISSHIENEFVHKHAGTIRDLAGHLSDLNSIMDGYEGNAGLPLHLFDEFLQKKLGVAKA